MDKDRQTVIVIKCNTINGGNTRPRQGPCAPHYPGRAKLMAPIECALRQVLAADIITWPVSWQLVVGPDGFGSCHVPLVTG